jgi:hypothetical protein
LIDSFDEGRLQKVEQGKWYTLQVEMVVDRTTTIIDHTALWATLSPENLLSPAR